jgi:hypothetical protein
MNDAVRNLDGRRLHARSNMRWRPTRKSFLAAQHDEAND